MFKHLVPVVALALLAGPVFAADAPATTPSSQSSAASGKSSHHSKKSHKSTAKSKKPSTDASAAPAK